MTQPLQICIGLTIRIGWESWCLPCAGILIWGLQRQLAAISGSGFSAQGLLTEPQTAGEIVFFLSLQPVYEEKKL